MGKVEKLDNFHWVENEDGTYSLAVRLLEDKDSYYIKSQYPGYVERFQSVEELYTKIEKVTISKEQYFKLKLKYKE